jgi:hypothetical protein
MYAFTHALMYVTDLGSRRPRLPRTRAGLAGDAETFIAWCLDEQDYDLGAEVLLSWPLLRLKWSATATFAFAVLANVEDRAGFLPSPGINLHRYHGFEGDERTRYAVAAAYHTAYVMGLLCAAALNQGCAPPASVPRRRTRRGEVQAIVELLDDDACERHWWQLYQGLEEPQQAALIPLVLDIAMQRAVTRRELALVQRAVGIALRTGCAGRTSVRQAVHLLQRATRLADSQTDELPVADRETRAPGADRSVRQSIGAVIEPRRPLG